MPSISNPQGIRIYVAPYVIALAIHSFKELRIDASAAPHIKDSFLTISAETGEALGHFFISIFVIPTSPVPPSSCWVPKYTAIDSTKRPSSLPSIDVSTFKEKKTSVCLMSLFFFFD
jgi:hypothetical protein